MFLKYITYLRFALKFSSNIFDFYISKVITFITFYQLQIRYYKIMFVSLYLQLI